MIAPQPELVVVSPEKTALVIVDMQYDFVDRKKGKQFTGPTVRRVISPIRNILRQSRELGVRVIYTQSWYQKDDPRYSNNPKANPGGFWGCMAGTWGAEIIEELKPEGSEPCIKKGSYDCFFGTNLEDLLLRRIKFGNFGHESVHRNRATNDCSVIITGTVATACVDKAVIGFYLRGYDVIVPADCIAAKTKSDVNYALRQFKRTYFAKITSSSLLKFEQIGYQKKASA